ncbi:condensation domain-containing protein [Sinorhizobium medicae]
MEKRWLSSVPGESAERFWCADSTKVTHAEVGRDGALPLSYSQQRLWFLAQLDEDSTNYNIPLGWRLQGRLDRVAWRRSLDRLFARHEALRCTFVAGEDDPQVQILSGDRGLPVVEHDLRDRPEAQAALLDLCQEEARTPFDLAREPLIRGRLIRLADEEHVFLLTQHHIVSDGWSLGGAGARAQQPLPRV